MKASESPWDYLNDNLGNVSLDYTNILSCRTKDLMTHKYEWKKLRG